MTPAEDAAFLAEFLERLVGNPKYEGLIPGDLESLYHRAKTFGEYGSPDERSCRDQLSDILAADKQLGAAFHEELILFAVDYAREMIDMFREIKSYRDFTEEETEFGKSLGEWIKGFMIK